MQQLQEFKQLINGSPLKVVITTHHKPDADALGSSLALYNYLIAKGHDAKVIAPTDYPRFLNWMKGQADVLVFNEEKQTAHCTALIAEADLICCLDFSALSRINEMGPFIAESKAAKLLVDHHLNPENFAQYELWDSKAAATCELIYDLIVMLGDEALIDKEIAECIYLPSYHCVAIIKTLWLKLVQRKWKNICKERKLCLLKRANPSALKYREIYGTWPNSCANYPRLKGMLSNLSRTPSRTSS
jgi:hypothetical protein